MFHSRLFYRLTSRKRVNPLRFMSERFEIEQCVQDERVSRLLRQFRQGFWILFWVTLLNPLGSVQNAQFVNVALQKMIVLWRLWLLFYHCDRETWKSPLTSFNRLIYCDSNSGLHNLIKILLHKSNFVKSILAGCKH